MPQKEIEYDDTYLESLKAEPVPEISGEFDPDAEYNRPAPPVEDGWYQMTFSNGGVYVEGAKRPFEESEVGESCCRSHMEINVTGTIIDSRQLSDRWEVCLYPQFLDYKRLTKITTGPQGLALHIWLLPENPSTRAIHSSRLRCWMQC